MCTMTSTEWLATFQRHFATKHPVRRADMLSWANLVKKGFRKAY
jgi:hypothetical protein